jgi:acetyl-CoA C-acetyltransferase
MGAFQGDFSALAAHDLGGAAIRAAVERAGVQPDAVGEVLFGNCLMAGQGQAPARQAAFKGGLPKEAGAVTLSKMCGSGMKAAMFAHDMLLAGTHDVMVAGGMESMTNAPYLLQKGRGGYRLGHDRIFDHMMLDGLEDAYEPGRSMGTFGEDCAAKYGFTRAEQDAFATASVERAKAATASGAFAAEITPVTVKSRAGETVVSVDEGPGKVKLDKIASLKPAFKKDGTITAASSSSINDGAAALVMMRASTATKLGCKPLARIVGHATHAQEPEWFATAPLGATQKALGQGGLGCGGCGSVGNQRSLRRGAHGADERAEPAARRTAGTRPQKGPGHAVHRRRRGHGRGGRAGLRATGAGRQRFWPRPGNASRTFPHRGTCWVVPGLLFI